MKMRIVNIALMLAFGFINSACNTKNGGLGDTDKLPEADQTEQTLRSSALAKLKQLAEDIKAPLKKITDIEALVADHGAKAKVAFDAAFASKNSAQFDEAKNHIKNTKVDDDLTVLLKAVKDVFDNAVVAAKGFAGDSEVAASLKLVEDAFKAAESAKTTIENEQTSAQKVKQEIAQKASDATALIKGVPTGDPSAPERKVLNVKTVADLEAVNAGHELDEYMSNGNQKGVAEIDTKMNLLTQKMTDVKNAATVKKSAVDGVITLVDSAADATKLGNAVDDLEKALGMLLKPLRKIVNDAPTAVLDAQKAAVEKVLKDGGVASFDSIVKKANIDLAGSPKTIDEVEKIVETLKPFIDVKKLEDDVSKPITKLSTDKTAGGELDRAIKDVVDDIVLVVGRYANPIPSLPQYAVIEGMLSDTAKAKLLPVDDTLDEKVKALKVVFTSTDFTQDLDAFKAKVNSVSNIDELKKLEKVVRVDLARILSSDTCKKFESDIHGAVQSVVSKAVAKVTKFLLDLDDARELVGSEKSTTPKAVADRIAALMVFLNKDSTPKDMIGATLTKAVSAAVINAGDLETKKNTVKFIAETSPQYKVLSFFAGLNKEMPITDITDAFSFDSGKLSSLRTVIFGGVDNNVVPVFSAAKAELSKAATHYKTNWSVEPKLEEIEHIATVFFSEPLTKLLTDLDISGWQAKTDDINKRIQLILDHGKAFENLKVIGLTKTANGTGGGLKGDDRAIMRLMSEVEVKAKSLKSQESSKTEYGAIGTNVNELIVTLGKLKS